MSSHRSGNNNNDAYDQYEQDPNCVQDPRQQQRPPPQQQRTPYQPPPSAQQYQQQQQQQQQQYVHDPSNPRSRDLPSDVGGIISGNGAGFGSMNNDNSTSDFMGSVRMGNGPGVVGEEEDISISYAEDDLLFQQQQQQAAAAAQQRQQQQLHASAQQLRMRNSAAMMMMNASMGSFRSQGDERSVVTMGTTQQQQLLELRDPAYLINLLEEMIPKIIREQHDGKTEAANQVETQQRRDQTEHVWERVRRWLWANPITEEPEEGGAETEEEHSMADDSMMIHNIRTAGAYLRGQNDMTPLHLVCKLHYPPEDIVSALIQAASDTPSWIDSHGWLPLHHACANGASPEVLTLLLEAFPEGKTTQDQQQRTPLHFYATRSSNVDNPTTMAANAALLAAKNEDGTSAAELSDTNGMLPIHYACAYGTHPCVLQALVEVNPSSVTAREQHGRTPMHLAMVNANREESPAVIRFLLDYNAESHDTINARDFEGYLPLHLLAAGMKQGARVTEDPEKRTTVSECLSMYLASEPHAGADFLTAIQDLPDWLQDTAVVSKHVRNILNEKIGQRFHTSILMMDGMILSILIVCFAKAVKNHIDLRFDPDDTEHITNGTITLVIMGVSYFMLREAVQLASLMSLGSVSQWFTDPANWLDMTVIVLVYYYAITMLKSPETVAISNNAFRTGVAFTQGVLWVAVVVYLKSTLVDFAVFVGGVFYVVQRLVAFMIAVGVILLAFAQMFYFVYLDTNMCANNLPDPSLGEDFQDCQFPHCTFGRSLLKVYVMMMGEIGDESRYATSLVAQILYVGYAFLVIILLSNILIAIVTDSYEIIQNDRAAIVFWSNRLDFVAEMDSIVYAIQRRVKPLWGGGDLSHADGGKGNSGKTVSEEAPRGGGTGGVDVDGHNANNLTADGDDENSRTNSLRGMNSNGSDRVLSDRLDLDIPQQAEDYDGTTDYFREAWQQVMSLFDANQHDDIDWIETWVYNLFRLFSFFVVIPVWLVLGFVTAGWLWPPQVREYLFVQKETAISRAELERQKLSQLKAIQSDLKELKQDIMREMTHDRDEMIRLKAEVETVQGEFYADLLQVKELMDSLLVM